VDALQAGLSLAVVLLIMPLIIGVVLLTSVFVLMVGLMVVAVVVAAIRSAIMIFTVIVVVGVAIVVAAELAMVDVVVVVVVETILVMFAVATAVLLGKIRAEMMVAVTKCVPTVIGILIPEMMLPRNVENTKGMESLCVLPSLSFPSEWFLGVCHFGNFVFSRNFFDFFSTFRNLRAAGSQSCSGVLHLFNSCN